MKKLLTICAVVALMLAVTGMTQAANTLYVGPSETYTTIQAAINAAVAGDTIEVAAGTYPEQIIIMKSLTIIGSDGAVLDGTSLGLQKVGVKIKSGNVTFDNIDVEHFSGNGIIVGYEASIPGSLQNVHITNCKISGIQPGYSHGFGIYAGYQSEDFKRPDPPKLSAHLDYSGLLIENNEITDSRSSSLVLQSITGTPGTLVVRNNYIHDGDNDGIWIDCAQNIVIEDNVVQNNVWGFYISSYGDAFQGVIDGYWTYDWTNDQLNGPYGPMNILITGNEIVDNTNEGVYLAAGHPATISINGNSITGNTPGVANYLSEPVDATYNWWGDVSGPLDEILMGDDLYQYNPGALGDPVSEYVLYMPWTGVEDGFVTGGGWIDSPVNEDYVYMLVGGKASFGFVSKYNKGKNVPDGSTNFVFEAGDLHFHSSSYYSLVVTGSDYAKFFGKGTINDSGEYKFMIWAGDGGKGGDDTFRIKIWEEDEFGLEDVVYDNGMDQVIDSGSIIIHTGNK